ncbi:urea active transporter [Marssonina coronariae]|uniref:Urea active transporter n=1 Tax=Diplocarpon coronariae TaxID=2795749 RepID=A0A218Z6P2_9HELO|nr:urea active transporter [Marssonina coronariae]
MQLRKRESVTSITPPLPQVGGYVVVVVVGLVFASAMVLVTKILKKTTGEDNSKTEMQVQSPRRQVAGTDPQQSWLWSTAMLGSCLVGYAYGISGPFWFAAGCSPMIVFFALLGISCKLKIPEAHTLLEIVRIRYGTVAHLVFMFLCLVNNLFAVANMLLGASAAIAALTGMHIIAATFLLPVGVVVYTFVGGIKATFLTDYIHTLTIMIVICYLTVKAFTVDEIGSVGQLYDLVVSASARAPIAGNHQGSYMTMTSKKGIYFGLIHVTSNFGLVIMDTGFFVKAFAASPRAVVPGYVVGGIAYFAIPWALGTLMSSVAWGIQDQPIWPTYPRGISSQEVGAGLVLPYAAMAIAGKGGAVAVLLVIFMAATSTSSAQIIAVSSIISFDIYRAYFAPDASDRDIIRWSHYGVVIFATIAAAFSTMLHYVGVDLSWTLYMLGVVTCPGIFPTVFTLLWRQQSRAAAIIAPLLGLATGMSIWLGSAYALHGTVTIASTGELLPCMYGCLASTFSPLPYSVFITLLQPQRFDWDDFLQEKLALGDADAADASSAALEETEHDEPRSRSDPRWVPYMRRWTIIATLWSAATFLGHFVLWPLPMYAAKYTFTKKASRASSPPLPSDLRFVADGRQFYSAWLVISIIWVWGTLLVAGLYPLIDGRRQILSICRALWKGEREGPESAAESTGADSSKGSTAVSVDAPLPGR